MMILSFIKGKNNIILNSFYKQIQKKYINKLNAK